MITCTNGTRSNLDEISDHTQSFSMFSLGKPKGMGRDYGGFDFHAVCLLSALAGRPNDVSCRQPPGKTKEAQGSLPWTGSNYSSLQAFEGHWWP